MITPVIIGTLGSDGWYTSNLTVNWTFDAPVESSTGCDATTIQADTTGATLTCSATRDGFTTTVSKTFKVDKTLPSASPFPGRPPDANGWYNHPLAVSFSGTDLTSGLASCSSASTYGGPDSFLALAAGSCTDNAGNVAGASFSFKYDATPPRLFAITAKLGNRTAEITWRKSTDTQVIEVLRAPGRNGQGESVVYRGSETGFRDAGLIVGRKYEYRVIGIDQAANRAERTIKIVATGALLRPAPGAHVTSPPTLSWIRVKGASYYNVQLIRGRKVLSAWSLRTSFRVPKTWVYRGRRYRLKPGVYRWYVWPGKGRISAGNYGRLLGSSTFVVVK